MIIHYYYIIHKYVHVHKHKCTYVVVITSLHFSSMTILTTYTCSYSILAKFTILVIAKTILGLLKGFYM